MKISAIQTYQNYGKMNVSSTKKHLNKKTIQVNQMTDSVSFNGKGKVMGELCGGAAGILTGGAIIGGGSLAGAVLLAATGPLGWALTAAYAVGGALAGGYVGGGIGQAIFKEDDDD